LKVFEYKNLVDPLSPSGFFPDQVSNLLRRWPYTAIGEDFQGSSLESIRMLNYGGWSLTSSLHTDIAEELDGPIVRVA